MEEGDDGSLPDDLQGIGLFTGTAASAPADKLLSSGMEHFFTKFWEDGPLQYVEYVSIAVKTGNGDVAERVEDWPLFSIALEISLIRGKSGQVQFSDTTAETLADLLMYFSIAGPAKPEPRQAPLEEFRAFNVLYQVSFGWSLLQGLGAVLHMNIIITRPVCSRAVID